MRVLLSFFFILLLNVFLNASEVLFQLEDTFKGPFILMNEKYICICDSRLYRFHTYSRDDFKKIAEFGEKGGGPGEGFVFSRVTLYKDSIYINQYPKLSIFSIKGELKDELKGPTDSGRYIPFVRDFVGIKDSNEHSAAEKNKLTFTLFDSDLEKKKDIFTIEFKNFVRYKGGKWVTLWVRDCFEAVVYDERLYIGNTDKGFFFGVFDKKGNKLYEINRDYRKLPITEDYKKWRLDRFRKLAGEERWNRHSKDTIVFPEYFPAYINFTVSDEKIYVFKHPGKEDQELLILDLNGKLLVSKTLPLIQGGIYEGNNLCIHGGRLYFVRDNEETEKWDVCFEKIE